MFERRSNCEEDHAVWNHLFCMIFSLCNNGTGPFCGSDHANQSQIELITHW